MTLAIKAEGIYKTFRSGWRRPKRQKEALKGVDLQIEEGEIFGILGPNGAGKTTFLSILSTLLLPDRGEVTILGMNSLPRRTPDQGEGQYFERQCQFPLEPDGQEKISISTACFTD